MNDCTAGSPTRLSSQAGYSGVAGTVQDHVMSKVRRKSSDADCRGEALTMDLEDAGGNEEGWGRTLC